MSEKAIGQIIINLYPKGRKEAVFVGEVTPNDVFYCKVALQQDYARYLNSLHIKHNAVAKEEERVKLEKETTQAIRDLTVQQEKERLELEKEGAKKLAKAKVEELRAAIVRERDEPTKVKLKEELKEAQSKLVKMV